MIGPPSPDDSAFTRHTVAAWELLRRGDFKPALAAFERALNLWANADVQWQQARHPAWQALQVGRGEALLMLGERVLSEQALLLAYPDLAQAPLPTPQQARPSRMHLRALNDWCRLQQLARKVSGMATLLQAWLALLPPDDPASASAWAEPQARLQARLAVTATIEGRVEDALALHAQAMQVFEQHLLSEGVGDLAASLANAGGDLWRLGRLNEAQANIARALAIFQGLVDAGHERHQAEVNLTQMNLAAVLMSQGEFKAAVALYLDVVRGYDTAVRRGRGRGDVARLRNSRAMAGMNLAYALFKDGQYDAAAHHYRATRQRFAKLKGADGAAGAGQFVPDEEIRTWVNQAHLLARQGQAVAALALYRRSEKRLLGLQAQGRNDLIPDSANARFGIARALVLSGRPRAGAAHFEGAQAALVKLTEEGQLQHGLPWLVALGEHGDALLRAGVSAPDAGQPLLQALQQAPRVRLHNVAAQGQEIITGLAALERWLTQLASAWLPAVATALLSHLLERMASLLGESEPEELRAHAALSQQCVQRLGAVALALPQAPLLLADWFLRTRGLRAQRSALAQGREPELVALREDLARLRRLEEEMLAAPTPTVTGARAQAEQTRRSEQAQQWRSLRARCDQARDALVGAGLLPPLLRLHAQALAAHMARGQALLMLARGLDQTLLAVLLRPALASGAQVAQAVLLTQGQAVPDCHAVHLGLRRAMRAAAQALRRGPDSQELAGAADALSPPSLEQAEQAARSVYEAVATPLLQPLMQTLGDASVSDLALVPSADLHLLPWHDLLGQRLASQGCRLSVYPDCGAWAHCTVLAPKRPRAPAAPRWALLASEAGALTAMLAEPLPWVVVERLLSLQLWAGSGGMQRLDPQRPRGRGINALVGMGHGHAPADNLALAGLWVAPHSVLSAHALGQVHSCQHVLMSCCVLGRVDEVHSEAMGFLSSSFGYQCRFGAGWLLEVPDAEACLFSLAFQHGLRTASQGKGWQWGAVFQAVRQGIAQGCWPAGFDPWLATHLPAAVQSALLEPGVEAGRWLNRFEYLRDFDGGLFAVPPPSLRRLMPWVIALGA